MTTLLAYLDAGTGSAIVAMIAGGFAAVAVTMRYHWNRVLVFLRIRKPEPEAGPQGSSSEKQPDTT
jgi:hypothetical protein